MLTLARTLQWGVPFRTLPFPLAATQSSISPARPRIDWLACPELSRFSKNHVSRFGLHRHFSITLFLFSFNSYFQFFRYDDVDLLLRGSGGVFCPPVARYPLSVSNVCRPDRLKYDNHYSSLNSTSLITRLALPGYGDTTLNNQDRVVDLTRLNQILSFNLTRAVAIRGRRSYRGV